MHVDDLSTMRERIKSDLKCVVALFYTLLFSTRANSHEALDYNLIILKKTGGIKTQSQILFELPKQ